MTGIRVHLAATPSGLCRLSLNTSDAGFLRRLQAWRPGAEWQHSAQDPLIVEAVGQLRAYFQKRLRRFDVPLELEGTPFQRAVWSALQRIPYGETRSYREIAAEIGRPPAARAVGQANRANPVALIVPCHRVIAAGGSLGGYASGLELKRFLLDLERLD